MMAVLLGFLCRRRHHFTLVFSQQASVHKSPEALPPRVGCIHFLLKVFLHFPRVLHLLLYLNLNLQVYLYLYLTCVSKQSEIMLILVSSRRYDFHFLIRIKIPTP